MDEILLEPAPRVPAALDDGQGLLPTDALTHPLDVVVSGWGNPLPGTTLELYWNGDLVDTFAYDGPDNTVTMTVPTNHLLLEGQKEIYYQVMRSGQAYPSEPTQVEIDRTPPAQGQPGGALEFPEEVETGGITDAYLDENGGKVDAIIRYADWKPGDAIFAKWGNKVLPEVPIGPPEQNGDIIVSFTGDALRSQVPNGTYSVSYYLKDRAGNSGPESRPSLSEIEVELTPAPIQLARPLVPAADDGLVTDADARVPVSVHIPGNIAYEAGDELALAWAGRLQPRATILPEDVGNDPIRTIPVPYSEIALAGNGTALVVDYDAFRGSALLGRSADTVVSVDLTLPGGPDPDPETPVNENLAAPKVVSASGSENSIPPADMDKDATAEIAWYSRATPPAEVFVENDSVVLTWSATPLAPYAVTAADVAAKQPLVLSVPTAVVSAETGLVQVRYSVRRDLGGGHENVALSPSQGVIVADESGLPGGGDPLPLGEFTERNPDNNAIGFESAKDGTPFRVAHYVNKAVGDIISMFYQGYDRLDGEGGPIEGAIYTQTHIVTAEDENTFFDFAIPPIPLLRVCYGRGVAYYTARNPMGEAKAFDQFVYLDTRSNENPYC